MNKYAIVFTLNNTEKIVVELEGPLNEIHCCYSASIAFFQKKKRTFLVEDTVHETMRTLNICLKKALNKKLKLDKSITKDIGFSYNEDAQYSEKAFYKNLKPKHPWKGNQSNLWSPVVRDGNLQTWIYNDKDGAIIFEITPLYPYHFCGAEEEDFIPPKNYILYQEWMKGYKPYLIRTIPEDVARQWFEQTKVIVRQIKKNIARECRRIAEKNQNKKE